jgi:cysteine desulfurase/selenocysteine lyase
MNIIDFAQVVRKDFPILKQRVYGKPLIYFDSAATSQKPRVVINAISHYYMHECGTVHRGVYYLCSQSTQKYHTVRRRTAQFIGAKSSEEIIFTRGTTEGINFVASGYRGKRVIISQMEHHSNIVPWQLAEAKIRVIPINDQAELDLEAFEALLKEGVDLVSIAHIANSTGTVNPIKTIIDMAHKSGAKVLIDAAQSPAHLPLNVTQLDCDYLAFSSHKAFGPTGLGVLYAKQEHLRDLSPVLGGGDMIERVTFEKTLYGQPPIKFEAGTPAIAQVIGWGVAIEYIDRLGLKAIQKHEKALTQYALKKLRSIEEVRFIGDAANRSSIISFVIEGVHHLDLATSLDLDGIAIRSGHQCAQPLLDHFNLKGTCRISFAPFNTIEEIDQFILSLKKAIETLGR